MKKAWRSEGYPKTYVDGFKLPDDEVVKRVIDQLETDNPVIRIQFKKDINGVVVYLRHKHSMRQINCAEPKKSPGDYLHEGYANTFWEFYGPNEQQIRRAQLLASGLSIDFGERPSEGMVSIPSLGLEFERPTSGIFAR